MKKTPYNAIDHQRCQLILLVILVHIVHFGDLYPSVKNGINYFFMPAFLLLTGYLVNIRKSASDFGRYLLRILLPYLIMTTGFAVASLYLPVRGGMELFSWSQLFHIVCVTSIGPYWFLHTMMVCGILYYLAFLLADAIKPSSDNTSAISSSQLSDISSAQISAASSVRFQRWTSGLKAQRMLLLLFFAILLALISYATPLLPGIYATFYFGGAFIRQMDWRWERVFPASWWSAIPFALLFAIPNYQAAGIISVWILAACFMSFAAAWGNALHGRLQEWSGYIGHNTFPIYIFHPLFTMAAKFMVPLFHFDPTGLSHAFFTIVMGTAGSLSIAWVMDRSGLSWIFGKGKMLR